MEKRIKEYFIRYLKKELSLQQCAIKLKLPKEQLIKLFDNMRYRITDIVFSDNIENDQEGHIFAKCFEQWYRGNGIAGSFEKVLGMTAPEIQTAFLGECAKRGLQQPKRSWLQDRVSYEWIEYYLRYKQGQIKPCEVAKELEVSRATVYNRFNRMDFYEKQIQNPHKINLK